MVGKICTLVSSSALGALAVLSDVVRKLICSLLINVVASVALSFLKTVVSTGCVMACGGIPITVGYVNVLLAAVIANVTFTLGVRMSGRVNLFVGVEQAAGAGIIGLEAGLGTSGLLTVVMDKVVSGGGDNLCFLVVASVCRTGSGLLTVFGTGSRNLGLPIAHSMSVGATVVVTVIAVVSKAGR